MAESTEIIQELIGVCELLDALYFDIDNLFRDFYSLSQDAAQEHLFTYANTLAYIPRSLQLLQDFRRHFPDLIAKSSVVQDQMISVRGDSQALSSEEMRIFVRVADVKKVILYAIELLENILLFIRFSTNALLEAIWYDKDDFFEQMDRWYQIIRPDLLHKKVYEVTSLLLLFAQDLMEFSFFEERMRAVFNDR